jgi:hypothetical protein
MAQLGHTGPTVAMRFYAKEMNAATGSPSGAPYCGHLARVAALGRRMRGAAARS